MGIRIKNFNLLEKLAKAVVVEIPKAIAPKQMQDLAEEAAVIIRERTRRGFGVDKPEGTQKKLKKLEDTTKTTRQGLKRRGKLSGETSPAKSNLTSSGQLLDALVGRSKGKGVGVVTILGKRNIEVAGHVIDERQFLNLSKREANKLIRELDKRLQTRINRKLVRIR